MSRLTLVLVVCSVVVAGIHFGVAKGEFPNDQLESPMEELEDANDRSGSAANAQTNALRQGLLRPRPGLQYPPKSLLAPKVGTVGQCYSCTGCPTPSNQSLVNCANSYDPNKQNKCVVYSEQYKYMKDPWITRGCVSERGTCEEIRKAHSNQDLVKMTSCNECAGAGCNLSNGAGNPLPDLFIAFIAVVATPILAQISLSKV